MVRRSSRLNRSWAVWRRQGCKVSGYKGLSRCSAVTVHALYEQRGWAPHLSRLELRGEVSVGGIDHRLGLQRRPDQLVIASRLQRLVHLDIAPHAHHLDGLASVAQGITTGERPRGIRESHCGQTVTGDPWGTRCTHHRSQSQASSLPHLAADSEHAGPELNFTLIDSCGPLAWRGRPPGEEHRASLLGAGSRVGTSGRRLTPGVIGAIACHTFKGQGWVSCNSGDALKHGVCAAGSLSCASHRVKRARPRISLHNMHCECVRRLQSSYLESRASGLG